MTGADAYAAGVDTAFDENDFPPPEEQPRYVDRRPSFDATATGQLVLYQSVAELILESAVVTLVTALVVLPAGLLRSMRTS